MRGSAEIELQERRGRFGVDGGVERVGEFLCGRRPPQPNTTPAPLHQDRNPAAERKIKRFDTRGQFARRAEAFWI